MKDFYLKQIIIDNPWIKENDIQEIIEINDYDILIKIKNDVNILFDSFTNTYKRVRLIDNDNQLKISFKRKLQTIMNRKFITQKELAEKIDSTQQMISRYLTGESIPNAITIKKIAKALNCRVDDFYDDYY